MLQHTHIYFNGHFPSEPGIARCPLHFPSLFILKLCILFGDAQPLRTLLHILTTSLTQMTPLACSNNFRHLRNDLYCVEWDVKL